MKKIIFARIVFGLSLITLFTAARAQKVDKEVQKDRKEVLKETQKAGKDANKEI